MDYLARYYYTKSLLYYKAVYEKIYNEKGYAIGIIIGLEEKIMDNLQILEGYKNKFGTHEQHSEVTNLLRTLNSELENYKYKNNLVNKEKIDASDALEKIPTLIKAQVPDNKFDLEVFSLPSLSLIKKSLINPKVKPMTDIFMKCENIWMVIFAIMRPHKK